MKPTTLLCFSLALVFASDSASAQAPRPDDNAEKILDEEISLMRKDLRDQKKQVVAVNLPLTGDEAARFWPMYDAYTQETTKVNGQHYVLVKEYAPTIAR